MKTKDFLLEIGTEELPPKLLVQLSEALAAQFGAQCEAAHLAYSGIQTFATPRRLAILVSALQLQQATQMIRRKGPAVGCAERAVAGFAKSCGVAPDILDKQIIDGANYYVFEQQKIGLNAVDLLAKMVDSAIKKIPIDRPMRWGDLDFYFARPTHWLIMLLADEVVPATIMGLSSGNTTRGLRFAGAPEFVIENASDYQKIMQTEAGIEVDFEARKALLKTQIMQVATNSKHHATAVIDEDLLAEVCALVEAPRAFEGRFEARFLAMPKEALISVMKLHQKYFHLVDEKGELLPAFIGVANINPADFSVIIAGNERVIRPRLSDAEFFWQQDKTHSLASRLLALDSVLFMQSLGSMYDKVKRIEQLTKHIAENMADGKSSENGVNVALAERAGLLSKSDLLSDMVGEFADLQGIMGGYYALNDGEDPRVVQAIREHYQPRFARDTLPASPEGLALSIADKLDTICGIYGIGGAPTGSKDPYALRRAALGVLKMMLEKQLDLDLNALIERALSLHHEAVDRTCVEDIYQFMMERLRAYYTERGVSSSIFLAVLAVHPASPYDFHLRVQALNDFSQQNTAKSLIAANKRIANMLKSHQNLGIDPDVTLLSEKAEQVLYRASAKIAAQIESAQNYDQIMQALLTLEAPIDDFFGSVMVNTEDEDLRRARLTLLNWVRSLFLAVADVSCLAQ